MIGRQTMYGIFQIIEGFLFFFGGFCALRLDQDMGNLTMRADGAFFAASMIFPAE
jgi:hypothetical protein